MTSVASRAVGLTVALVVLVLAITAMFVTFNSAGVHGIAIGVALGIVNLVVGLALTRRSLRYGMKSATATLLGGFAARVVAVVGLYFIFRQTSSIDAPAFALAFMALFFVYLAAEIYLVEHSHPSRAT